MTRQQFVTLIGVVLFAVGLAGFLWPVTATTSAGSVVCGTITSPEYTTNSSALDSVISQLGKLSSTESAILGGASSRVLAKGKACDDSMTGRHLWIWPVGLAGLAAVIYAGAVMQREEQASA